MLNRRAEFEYPLFIYDFQKRYKRRIAQRGSASMDVGLAKKNLEDLAQVLSGVGVEFFLLYGTLLGAIRDRDLIIHDTDIDIGIFIKYKPLIPLALQRLETIGFNIIRSSFNECGALERLSIMRHDEYVDIGIFSTKKKYFRNFCGYGNNWHSLELFLSFDKAKIGEKSYLVPTNSKKLLKLWYGRNWRIPKKNRPAITSMFIRKKITFAKQNIKYLIVKLISTVTKK